MQRPGAPLGEQILILIFGPPIMSILIWLLSRRWALIVQGGVASERTKKRQKWEFVAVLIGLYAMAVAIFGYAWLTGR